MIQAVEVSQVRHRYGTRVALDGVSLGVASGELFGVIGPNGSGKSTLFSLLNTSRVPQEGRIAIGDVDVAKDAARARRGIGVVFQRSTVDKYLTCRENLLIHATLHGVAGAGAAARVYEALEAAGLADRAGERAGTLSGGLLRRLELARALLHLPAVLLLDEPVGGLDPQARHDFWSRLAEWRRVRGLTILVTTHDMREAAQCDRLALLDAGRIVATGTAGELTRALGTMMVTLHTDDPAAVTTIVREKFRGEPMAAAGEVRFASGEAHALVGPLATACGPLAASITVGPPTLEDVFLSRTGRKFREAVE